MRVKIHTVSLLGLLIHFACSSSIQTTALNNTLPAGSLYVYGRYAVTSENHVELISSASHTGFSFTGSQCQVSAYVSDPNNHSYLQYEVDNVYQKRIKITGSRKQSITIDAGSHGKHTVWIYKATEAHSGPVFIEKIIGKELKPLQKTETKSIEFIGNSITCGAAADPSEVPCGSGVYHDQHNAYFAYGPRVARALNANYVLSSVSGIGVYRNWNSDGPTMPQVYEQTDFQHGSQRIWNFEKSNPAIVSIALGTNDFSHGDGKRARLPFDSVAFVSSYINFVKWVKAKYPASQIALLSSPMLNGDQRITLQNCLTAVKANINALNTNDKPVALFFFDAMNPSGCSSHPSVEDHAKLAEVLIPFFEKLLSVK